MRKPPAEPSAQQTLVYSGVCVCVRGWQKDYRRARRSGSSVPCWFVHNSGKGLIDGHYSDYIVPQLRSFLPPSGKP